LGKQPTAATKALLFSFIAFDYLFELLISIFSHRAGIDYIHISHFLKINAIKSFVLKTASYSRSSENLVYNPKCKATFFYFPYMSAINEIVKK
jgi:hypothetical protein